tara:strand:+ start:1084 stop:1200 length:117 start_codon:yes stop_codon:yes gene_type:complete
MKSFRVQLIILDLESNLKVRIKTVEQEIHQLEPSLRQK